MIQKSTISFLKNLAKSNQKAWFDEHRDEYLAAKGDYEKFVATLIQKTGAFDADINQMEAKKCTFRINRDIRFSKNKTPYKVNMGASLNRDGKKSIYAGYYFHLEPGNKSFAGGGLWMPMAEDLKKLRQEIDYNFDEFKKIVSSKSFIVHFKELDTSEGAKLVNVPRGYEKDNPAAEFLKFKSLVALQPIQDAELFSPMLANNTAKTFKALQPLIQFINRSLD